MQPFDFCRCRMRNHLTLPDSDQLKSDSKVTALNRKIDAVSRPSIGFLSFSYRSEALIEYGFNLEVLLSKSLLASNPKGLKNRAFRNPKGAPTL